MDQNECTVKQHEAQHADSNSEAPSKAAQSSPEDVKPVSIASNEDSATPAEPVSLAQYHRENCVSCVADDIFAKEYFYHSEALKMGNSEADRMPKIVREVASLVENLPEGIYVRYPESRPDTMKVLIIGANGTPYEKGFFEFDILCPADYPKQPPNVQFKTTGRGTLEFNPNLHSDGVGEYN